MKELVACVRDHGLDAPTAPDAFKRWVADKEANDPGALDAVMRACKMSLDPGPSKGPGKPGACVNDVRPPTMRQGQTPPSSRTRPTSKAPEPPRRLGRGSDGSPEPRRSAARSSSRTRASTSSLHSCVRIRR